MELLPSGMEMRSNRADTRLIAAAIKQRWNIPEKYRDALIARQVLIASGRVEDASPREQTAAFNALLAADAINQQDELAQMDRQVRHTHLVRLEPVTADNLAEHKRRLLEDLGS